MPKIIEVSSGVYTVNGIVISSNTHCLNVHGDSVGIYSVGANKDFVSHQKFDKWTNPLNVPYSDLESLISDLTSFFFSSTVSEPFSKIVFSQEVPSLLDGEEIDTDFIDFAGISKQQITIRSDQLGLDFVQDLKIDLLGQATGLSIPIILTENTLNIVVRERYQRIRIQNNSGQTINNVVFQIKSNNANDGATVLPLSSPIAEVSQALLGRSVLTGVPAGSNDFVNVVVNPDGALLTSDYGSEVAQGKFENVKSGFATGRNSDIDILSAPEDIWSGGGDYTGFDCVQAERIEFFSSSSEDSGTLLSQGVSTGGSTTTIEDSNANFIADGVTIGDLLINDSQQIHGVISNVSSTILTVINMTNDEVSEYSNGIGESYRVATTNGNGAAVCRFFSMLNNAYEEFGEYVIMNGTSGVLSINDALRHSEGKVVLCGSFGTNQGEITGRQSITTANITMVIPENSGKTAICCRTVPKGEKWLVFEISSQMARFIGSPGSAGMRFQSRKLGEAWQTVVFPEISNSLAYYKEFKAGRLYSEFTDLKWNCQFVSDNNTIVSADFEYFRYNNI